MMRKLKSKLALLAGGIFLVGAIAVGTVTTMSMPVMAADDEETPVNCGGGVDYINATTAFVLFDLAGEDNGSVYLKSFVATEVVSVPDSTDTARIYMGERSYVVNCSPAEAAAGLTVSMPVIPGIPTESN